MSDPIGAASRIGAGIPRPMGPDATRPYTADFGIGKQEKAGSFGDAIAGFVNQVSEQQDRAGELAQRYLRGEQVEVHQVTAAAEEAGIALDLMVEIRNKMLDAYRTLTTMQG